jgi:hypothetical protein
LLEESTETANKDHPSEMGGRGKKESQGIVAGGLEIGKGMVGAMDNAREILEGMLRDAPTTGAKSAA